MVIVYIGIGSNIDAKQNISRGVELLHSHFGKVEESPWYETRPFGMEDQGYFCNLVVRIKTERSPEELLEVLLTIEKKLNRERSEKNGPRTIDLDILLYGSDIIDERGLTIPHKEMKKRDFVLVPLLDLDPDIVDPMSQKKFSVIEEKIKEKYIIKKVRH